MIYGISTSGLGAYLESSRIDVIANNLANVNTPGFRRDQMAFRERLVEAHEDRPDLRYVNDLVDRYGGAPFVDEIAFDRQPGAPDYTGRNLDMAINGEGFFALRNLESGERCYTRAGNFQFDRSGRMLSADGKYQALNAAGEPIAVDPEIGACLVVRDNGGLFSGNEQVAAIGVVDFRDYDALSKSGDNVFRFAGNDQDIVAPTGTTIMSGVLEGSSVNPVVEMTEMIRTLRSLEANLQMIKFQDSTLEKAVNELARLPR
ncbi:MAG: hypothetical protein A2Z34_08255 [Planctomycetes bacterium RBG_16_59_8]|nr:MAG: hypothetical protein A2Z34_08255 [Planctomycetes bacterium RBG_16_59_8]